jgi:hypothetical protein
MIIRGGTESRREMRPQYFWHGPVVQGHLNLESAARVLEKESF